MAIVFDGPVTPDAATLYIRSLPSPSDLLLSAIFPDRLVTKNTIDISELTRRNRTARFRAYDARLHVSERDTATLRQVKLPALSSSITVGEFERLQIEMTRLAGTDYSSIVDAVYDDLTNLTAEVRNRMEQARGDVLTDGKLTFAGEGQLTMEADYGVPANHIVTAGTLWTTTASADIIADLTSWVNTYLATNGSRPTGMVVSTRVLNLMLQNAGIRTLSASLIGTPGLVSRPSLDAALAAYGLPPIVLVYDTQVDVDGVDTRVTPDNRVFLVSDNIGYTAWGISATALELVNSRKVDIAFADAPGIVGAVIKEGPPFRQYSFVDAVGLPVLEQPRKLLVATVA
jgi:hypothetical protein